MHYIETHSAHTLHNILISRGAIDIRCNMLNHLSATKTYTNGYQDISHPITSGKWTKPNENTQLPQANGRNKMKIPNCLRQMDENK